MRLDELLQLPKSGVVVLQKHDSVLVSYTTNMGSELQDLYSMFRGQSGIVLKVLSSGVDLETLKLHTEYYRKFYHGRLCYRPINPYSRKTLEYKVRAVPSKDFKYIDIELVTARGDSKFVGRFKTKKEAGAFIETCYGPSNPFRFPVYAANSDTKEFLAEQESKLLNIR